MAQVLHARKTQQKWRQEHVAFKLSPLLTVEFRLLHDGIPTREAISQLLCCCCFVLTIKRDACNANYNRAACEQCARSLHRRVKLHMAKNMSIFEMWFFRHTYPSGSKQRKQETANNF